jgi:cytochrome P450
VAIAEGIAAYRRYLRDLVDDKAREPADDLTSDLLAIHAEDPRPNAEEHLAFGRGLHYCLGANLGRLEAQIAIAELARRLPFLSLVPDQRLTFHPNISFRGPQALLVRAG